MSEDTFRNTITLTDAARMTGPSVFNIMIKPCGSVCNLDCRYCYYLDKASLYGGHEPKMSDELLEKVVYPRYRLGNVRDTSLRDLAASSQALQFGIDKRNTLPRECRRCEFLNICHGGCPQHRLSRASNGEAGKNSLCEGLKMFWRHSAPAMQKMRELLAQNRAPAEITGL